jgi:hypothetical protein
VFLASEASFSAQSLWPSLQRLRKSISLDWPQGQLPCHRATLAHVAACPLEHSLPAFHSRLFADVAAIGCTFPVAFHLGRTPIDTPAQAVLLREHFSPILR